MKVVLVEVTVAEMVEVEVRSRKNLAFLWDTLDSSPPDSTSMLISFTVRLKVSRCKWEIDFKFVNELGNIKEIRQAGESMHINRTRTDP